MEVVAALVTEIFIAELLVTNRKSLYDIETNVLE